MYESLLQALGTVVDTPGSVTRGLGSGVVRGLRGLLGDEEQSQLAARDFGRAFAGIGDPSQRVYGSEWTGDPWSGMAVDMVADPLNVLGGVGLLKGAKAAKLAKANNKAAMATLEGTGYFDRAIPAELRGIAENAPPGYAKAMEGAARMSTRSQMLKKPFAEAVKDAKTMSRDDFVFGPAKTANPPKPLYGSGVADELDNLGGEMPEDMAAAWNTIASRYPRTTRSMMVQATPEGALAGYMVPINSGKRHGTSMIGIRPDEATPETFLHEILHVAQNKLGIIPPEPSAEFIHKFLEPSAWRRSIEASRAGSLYDYGNALQRVPRQSPLLAALLAGNAARTQRY